MQNFKTFIRMFRQLMAILNKKQKRQVVGVAFMSMVTALLETLGISVVIPFIVAMLQPEKLLEYRLMRAIVELLHLEGEQGILLLAAFMIIAVYVLKNGFILLFNYVQSNFRNTLERDLSILMLRSYAYKPYSFHLNTNSAEIMRGITSDISGVAAVVDGYCGFLNEGLTCILIGAILIAMNPFIAISLLLLAGMIAGLIVVTLRKKISSYGKGCRAAFAKRHQYAYQTINGIKEIDVMKRQDNFIASYADASAKACNYNTKYLWICKFPSRAIEVTFITGLLLLVCISTNPGTDNSLLIAQFGMLAVASLRILPSISNIAASMNSLVYYRPALEAAYSNIKAAGSEMIIYNNTVGEDKEQKVEFKKEIQINHISWKYAEKLPYVIKDLSLTIKKGEAIGLIGESGAGKTTLADIVLGLFKPQQGTITVDGKDIFEENTKWSRLIGYVPQSVFLIDDTIRNNILFGIPREEADEERIEQAIKQAQLQSFVDSLPNGLNTVLGERGVKISGGQRQRIAIARALYYNPDILVLDEATSALDTETENAVMESIDALCGHKTLIIVAHRLTTIANCDKIYEVKEGKAYLRDKQEVLSGYKDEAQHENSNNSHSDL